MEYDSYRIKFGLFKGRLDERSRFCHRKSCNGCTYCSNLPYVLSYLRKICGQKGPELATAYEDSWESLVLDAIGILKEAHDDRENESSPINSSTSTSISAWLSRSLLPERFDKVSRRFTKSH